MSTRFCSRCGAVLRAGVCPRGHPQRANRRARRRRGRSAVLTVLVILLLSAVGYAALFWYPARAAGELMRPTSAEFADALQAYRATTAALPPPETDPEAVPQAVGAILDRSDDARLEISRAQGSLESREPTPIPIVSGRSPLAEAREVREDMLAFYTSALETVANLEGVAGYLTEITSVLPQADNLQEALGDPDDGQVGAIVAASSPIAQQLVADLRALVPPSQLGGLHESLLAIARRIRGDLEDAGRAGGQAGAPVAQALLTDIRQELAEFRTTVGEASAVALEAGLAGDLQAVEDQADGIADRLRSLREHYGVAGLTIP